MSKEFRKSIDEDIPIEVVEESVNAIMQKYVDRAAASSGKGERSGETQEVAISEVNKALDEARVVVDFENGEVNWEAPAHLALQEEKITENDVDVIVDLDAEN